jgi:hypothetical protein
MPPSMSYLTATLTRAEISLISDPNRPCCDTIRDLDIVSQSIRRSADQFEECLRIKNTLDAFGRRASVEPSLEVLAAIVNCEYKLWKMNEDTPVRFKPFLSHWIETLMAIDGELVAWQLDTVTESHMKNTVTTDEILRIRSRCIKGFLVDKPLSPEEPIWRAYQRMLENEASLPDFDIIPYMQMLVETQVWDRLPEVHAQAIESHAQSPKPTPRDKSVLRKAKTQGANGSESWEEGMLRKLRDAPDVAADELSRLPLEISSLDFLTRLLVDDTFKELGIDGPNIILRFIQHALRLVEKMEAPPPTSELTTNGTSHGRENGTPIVEYGKEAQTRAISILLLFIKSSMSKGKLDAGLLIFEIQEICIRYLWMKEVRDFRAWIEQGPLDD